MEYRIGAPVFADDGQVGQLDRVILDPATHAVVGLVVVQGWLLSHDVAVPAGWVQAADEHGIRVSGTSERLDALESVTQSQYTVPPDEWIPPDGTASSQFLFPASPYAVGAFTMPSPQLVVPEEIIDLEGDDVSVNDGTPVFCTDGAAGTVSRVITVSETSVMDSLVVDTGGMNARLVAVPLDRVTAIGDDRVNLALAQRELDALPEWETAEPMSTTG